jgi:hypothetical protein
LLQEGLGTIRRYNWQYALSGLPVAEPRRLRRRPAFCKRKQRTRQSDGSITRSSSIQEAVPLSRQWEGRVHKLIRTQGTVQYKTVWMGVGACLNPDPFTWSRWSIRQRNEACYLNSASRHNCDSQSTQSKAVSKHFELPTYTSHLHHWQHSPFWATPFLRRFCRHSAAARIMSFENSKDLIGSGTRDLPVCSIMSQPTTLPRAPNRNTHHPLSVSSEHLIMSSIMRGLSGMDGSSRKLRQHFIIVWHLAAITHILLNSNIIYITFIIVRIIRV